MEKPDNASMILATLLSKAKLEKFAKRALLQVAWTALASVPTSPKWSTRDTRPDLLFSAFDDLEEKAIQQFVATILLAFSEDFLRSDDIEAIVKGQQETVVQVAMTNVLKKFKKWDSNAFPKGLNHEAWNGESQGALNVWYEKLQQIMTNDGNRASLMHSWKKLKRHLQESFHKVEALIDNREFLENGIIRLARAITTLVQEPEVFFHRNPWAMIHEELTVHLKSMFDIDRLGIMDIIRKQLYDSTKIPRMAIAELGGELCGDVFFKTLFDFSVFQEGSERFKTLNKKFYESFGSNHLHMLSLSDDHRAWLALPDVFRNDPLQSEGKKVWIEAFDHFKTFYSHCDESNLGKMVALQSPKYNELDYRHLQIRCQKLVRIAGVNGAVEDEFCSRAPVEKQPYCPEHIGHTADQQGQVYEVVRKIIANESKVK